VEASIAYLVEQFRAGVDAVQIFDSWAGALAGDEFRRWCVEPVAAIVAGVRAQVRGRGSSPSRGAWASAELAIAAELPVQAFGIGQGADLAEARRALGGRAALQGNLDPDVLVEGGDALDRGVDAVSPPPAAIPTSSTSGTASCPIRRSPTSSGCWPE
jgi:uroporphyrinogen decarboxylase